MAPKPSRALPSQAYHDKNVMSSLQFGNADREVLQVRRAVIQTPNVPCVTEAGGCARACKGHGQCVAHNAPTSHPGSSFGRGRSGVQTEDAPPAMVSLASRPVAPEAHSLERAESWTSWEPGAGTQGLQPAWSALIIAPTRGSTLRGRNNSDAISLTHPPQPLPAPQISPMASMVCAPSWMARRISRSLT